MNDYISLNISLFQLTQLPERNPVKFTKCLLTVVQKAYPYQNSVLQQFALPWHNSIVTARAYSAQSALIWLWMTIHFSKYLVIHSIRLHVHIISTFHQRNMASSTETNKIKQPATYIGINDQRSYSYILFQLINNGELHRASMHKALELVLLSCVVGNWYYVNDLGQRSICALTSSNTKQISTR